MYSYLFKNNFIHLHGIHTHRGRMVCPDSISEHWSMLEVDCRLMRSYTHVAGALLLFISFSYLINLNNLYLGLFVAGWISLFPDILERLSGTHRGYGHSIFWLIPL